MTLTRRQFLTTTAVGLALPSILRGADPARNYRTALIGCGWWGMNILNEAMAARQCKVVGLCDVDSNARETSAEHVKDQNGDEPHKYSDFRELLDREKPEIAIIATPDHWHALIS